MDESKVMKLQGDGGNYLFGLLLQTPDKLGGLERLYLGEHEVKVDGLLGQGGSAIVYKAIYQVHQQYFVLKMISCIISTGTICCCEDV